MCSSRSLLPVKSYFPRRDYRYVSAVVNKLRRSNAAEGANFARVQEPIGILDSKKERVELNTATKDLLAIKVRKLGFPDPTK